ncbi:hypothetical protein F5Y12DRAFT_717650 [Xylaria sp. FL1777]|nr:hypothetical protein F5Y12DRAFT_717650 [Xylaria sp. FL1777]
MASTPGNDSRLGSHHTGGVDTDIAAPSYTSSRRQTQGTHRAPGAGDDRAGRRPTTGALEAHIADLHFRASHPETLRLDGSTYEYKGGLSRVGSRFFVVAVLLIFFSFLTFTAITLASLIRTLAKVVGIIWNSGEIFRPT